MKCSTSLAVFKYTKNIVDQYVYSWVNRFQLFFLRFFIRFRSYGDCIVRLLLFPSGVSLCVVGVSGSGKTALCAKLADSLYQWQQALPATAEDAEALRNRPVKIVFCGTSSDSFDALNMLRSVCRHISLVLDKPMQDCGDVLKMDYDTVMKHFHGLVRDYRVVALFDSLDQLSNAHLARSDISFLKGIRPHRLSRIIVSTLPDELKQGNKGHIFKVIRNDLYPHIVTFYSLILPSSLPVFQTRRI